MITHASTWNYAEALNRTLGKDEILLQVIQSFIGDCNELVDQLFDVCNESDAEQVIFMAHSIKGMAANVGAEAFSCAAKDLEIAARQNDAEQYMALYAELNAQKHLLYKELELFIARVS